MNIDGKRILITGGSSGIGLALAHALLAKGAKVVLIEKASGRQLPETVTRVASTVPVGALRIRLPEAIEPGTYFLRALTKPRRGISEKSYACVLRMNGSKKNIW